MNHLLNMGTYNDFSQNRARLIAFLQNMTAGKVGHNFSVILVNIASTFAQKGGKLSAVPAHTLLQSKGLQVGD